MYTDDFLPPFSALINGICWLSQVYKTKSLKMIVLTLFYNTSVLEMLKIHFPFFYTILCSSIHSKSNQITKYNTNDYVSF